MIHVGVSGLTGLIGRNFVDWYSSDPAVRERLSLTAFTRRERCPEFLSRADIACRRVDLSDAGSFAGTLEDIDVFVHLAGQVQAVRPREFYEVNRDGTAVLMKALCRYGLRLRHLLFASSQAAAGPAVRDETQHPCPVSHYGRSKLAAEEAVRATELNWTILRLSPISGPYDRYGLIVLKAARLGVLPVIGGVESVTSYIFAQDLAPLLAEMLLNERLYRGTFNVCYDDPILVSDYCRAVRQELGLPSHLIRLPLPRWTGYAAMGALAVLHRALGGKSVVTADKVREFMAGSWVQANDRIRSALGRAFLCERGALAETVRWFRERGLL